MTLDTHTEQLTLLRHLGHVAMKVRLTNGQPPRGLFGRRDGADDPARTIHVLADTVHNVEGLAAAIEGGDLARAMFLADLMAGVYAEQAHAGVLSNVPFTTEAIDALQAIKAKAEAAIERAAA